MLRLQLRQLSPRGLELLLQVFPLLADTVALRSLPHGVLLLGAACVLKPRQLLAQLVGVGAEAREKLLLRLDEGLEVLYGLRVLGGPVEEAPARRPDRPSAKVRAVALQAAAAEARRVTGPGLLQRKRRFLVRRRRPLLPALVLLRLAPLIGPRRGVEALRLGLHAAARGGGGRGLVPREDLDRRVSGARPRRARVAERHGRRGVEERSRRGRGERAGRARGLRGVAFRRAEADNEVLEVHGHGGGQPLARAEAAHEVHRHHELRPTELAVPIGVGKPPNSLEVGVAEAGLGEQGHGHTAVEAVAAPAQRVHEQAAVLPQVPGRRHQPVRGSRRRSPPLGCAAEARGGREGRVEARQLLGTVVRRLRGHGPAGLRVGDQAQREEELVGPEKPAAGMVGDVPNLLEDRPVEAASAQEVNGLDAAEGALAVRARLRPQGSVEAALMVGEAQAALAVHLHETSRASWALAGRVGARAQCNKRPRLLTRGHGLGP
mmetsp:Transcript_72930/g.211108  ORF Transcript_72930/g.211108 Transcript_72930/m.211108 type:complete len:491 (-) Transcript_72930:8-1480(-)